MPILFAARTANLRIDSYWAYPCSLYLKPLPWQIAQSMQYPPEKICWASPAVTENKNSAFSDEWIWIAVNTSTKHAGDFECQKQAGISSAIKHLIRAGGGTTSETKTWFKHGCYIWRQTKINLGCFHFLVCVDPWPWVQNTAAPHIPPHHPPTSDTPAATVLPVAPQTALAWPEIRSVMSDLRNSPKLA